MEQVSQLQSNMETQTAILKNLENGIKALKRKHV